MPPADGGRGVGGLRREERCAASRRRAGGWLVQTFPPTSGRAPCVASNSRTRLEDCVYLLTGSCVVLGNGRIPSRCTNVTRSVVIMIYISVFELSPPDGNLGRFRGWNACTYVISHVWRGSEGTCSDGSCWGRACVPGSFP